MIQIKFILLLYLKIIYANFAKTTITKMVVIKLTPRKPIVFGTKKFRTKKFGTKKFRTKKFGTKGKSITTETPLQNRKTPTSLGIYLFANTMRAQSDEWWFWHAIAEEHFVLTPRTHTMVLYVILKWDMLSQEKRDRFAALMKQFL